jgi:hypothetical protein
MNIRKLRRATVAGTVTVVTSAVCALCWGTPARAQSDAGQCSNQTLNGSYGFAIDGQILYGPYPGLLRGVAMTHFDGRGNLGQVDFATLNGIPRWTGWRPVTGTYQMNPDCTGQAVLNPSDGSPSLHLYLVVARHGQEITTVVAGNATGSHGVRVN